MCAGLAPRIRPRIPPPPCSCYTLRSAWPSTPSAVAGAARGTDISTPGIVLEHGEPACIGTHYTQRPHRCVRGAFKGAIASACGRASRPRSRPSAAPFLAGGQDAHSRTLLSTFPLLNTPQSTTHTQSAAFTCVSVHFICSASSGPSSDFFFGLTSPSFELYLPSINP